MKKDKGTKAQSKKSPLFRSVRQRLILTLDNFPLEGWRRSRWGGYKKYSPLFPLCAFCLCAFVPFVAYGIGEESASEIMQKSHEVFYYQGDDLKAKVYMELITKDGQKRIRRMTMLRKNIEKAGNQKYFIYFHEPGDVRKMTLLVNKFPQKDDDRWIFIPAVNLVKRIAAQDSRSSFVGSDFTYEDVSGRDLADDNFTLLKEERLGENEVFVIQSVPKKKMDYSKQILWIDKKSYLPIKEEYYDHQDKLLRVFTADQIEEKPLLTITKRTMKNMQTGHRTEVTYTEIQYNQGLEENLFSEQSLRNPPQKWIE